MLNVLPKHVLKKHLEADVVKKKGHMYLYFLFVNYSMFHKI